MEIEITKKESVTAAFLQVSAGVRYWENANVNGLEDEFGSLIPCRNGDRWEPKIDISTGNILNWTQGVRASLHYKVCDDGQYTVLDENEKQLLVRDGYVPDIMCPKEEGYGDYIIMDIDENGFIQNWKPDLSDFQEED